MRSLDAPRSAGGGPSASERGCTNSFSCGRPAKVGGSRRRCRVARVAPQECPPTTQRATPRCVRMASRSERDRAMENGPSVPPERPQPRWSQRMTGRSSSTSAASGPRLSHRPGPPWHSTSGTPGPSPVRSTQSSTPSSASIHDPTTNQNPRTRRAPMTMKLGTRVRISWSSASMSSRANCGSRISTRSQPRRIVSLR